MASWNKKKPVILLEHGNSQRAGALAQTTANSANLSGAPAFSVDPLYENQREP